jgi:hypothetical protein
MRMIEPGKALTPIQQQREFRRESHETRVGLQQGEQFGAKRSRVEQRKRIAPGKRAHHHIAHIVRSAESRCVQSVCRGPGQRTGDIRCAARPHRPKTCIDQRRDQCRLVPVSHAAHLQIRAIGQLDHTGRMPLAHVGNHQGLRGAQLAAGQFDPANPPIARGDDAQQPRTRRGPQHLGRVGQSSGGRSLIQDGHRV